jgi:Icc-related predicted phosphoesterase
MIIHAISDLHGYYPKLPSGELLIISGDITARDTLEGYEKFDDWLKIQDFEHKIICGGNHDSLLQSKKYEIKNGIYLQDSGIEIEGLQFYATPWTKTFYAINPSCKAFTVDTEEELQEKFSLIPEHIDILITHSPPLGILDGVVRRNGIIENVGSISLRNIVLDEEKFKRLKLHCFGHIHSYGGKSFETTLTKFVNTSHVNEAYEPVNGYQKIIL